jgi:2-polyprenyl-3-methyl-5-hydroxy-6-metoxy-1,4-benzoquinol methylase
MKHAFLSVGRVLTFQAPARTLPFLAISRLVQTFGGTKRYEFERLYSEKKDPWNYHNSRYEREKYARTLDRILEASKRRGTALEIGCSIGVFSAMLAAHFETVVAVDFSQEAIKRARALATAGNLSFARGDVTKLRLNRRFDVIVCAETLDYLELTCKEAVCNNLAAHLAQDGFIVFVGAVSQSPSAKGHAEMWGDALEQYFRIASVQRITEESRPYQIVILRDRLNDDRH